MKGYLYYEVETKDKRDPNGTVLQRAVYDPEDLPTDLTELELVAIGYRRIPCTFNGAKKEFLANAIGRKFVVIDGIPFYSSSGTSESKMGTISAGWRKDIWMPCMGFTVQGKELGRVAKLGDKVSESFKAFAEKLVKDWSEKLTDKEFEGVFLLIKEQNRKGADGPEILNNLAEEIYKRYGSEEAFAISMQLVSGDDWVEKGDNGEDFGILRSLRDYYLTHYKYAELSVADLELSNKYSFN